MPIPDYIDYVLAENTAASMMRGLRERHDSWGHLVSISQRILMAARSELRRSQENFDPAQKHDLSENSAIVAASRILDAASISIDTSTRERRDLALLAAAAFTCYGNFPSAHVAAQRALEFDQKLSPDLALALGCLAPRLLPILRAPASSNHRTLIGIEAAQAFLQSGQLEYLGKVRAALADSIKSTSDVMSSILLSYADMALAHIETLSTKRCLSKFSGLAETVVRLLESNVQLLLPTQHHVFCKTNFLISKQNALIALPTSTGKTLIGEIAIAAALSEGKGLAVYIAPYVSIGTQAAAALRAHLPANCRVSLFVGGLRPEHNLNPANVSEVVVATPERLDSLTRSTGFFDHLKIVVVDEAHSVANGIRGVHLESLLTRFRMRQKKGESFRLVALSAVIGDSDTFREWLGVEKSLMIVNTWRPTVRRIAVWSKDNTLVWLYAGDELRPRGFSKTDIFGTKQLAWPNRLAATTDFAGQRFKAPLLFQNIAYLCKQVSMESKEPVLCICMSRASSRGVAQQLTLSLEPLAAIPNSIAAIIDAIHNEAKHLLTLHACLKYGVAYHNASLPLKIRTLIEKAVQARDLRIVCSTTTLAEGVDLPFRMTIIAEWLTWRLDTKDKQRPIEPLMFRNIAGRSGRAGVFTEGDTIVFENIFGPSRYVDDQFRTNALLSILDSPSELRSAIEEDVIDEENVARKHTLASNFLAAIPENPNSENLAKEMADSLLARATSAGKEIDQVMLEIKSEAMDVSRGALAVAASPLKLTAFGEAARKSLFSPNSCRQILGEATSPVLTGNFDKDCTALLIGLGGLPEQRNVDWKKIALGRTAKNFPVKRDDLEAVITNRRLGKSYVEIFVELPAVKRSQSAVKLSEWLESGEWSDHWAGVYDKFSDFMGTVVEEFLLWLLQCCERLVANSIAPANPVPWSEYINIAESLAPKIAVSTEQ